MGHGAAPAAARSSGTVSGCNIYQPAESQYDYDTDFAMW